MAKALEGIRIADLSHVLAAPTASMILADLGAEVIHIEPPVGDDARHFGPLFKGQSAYFISINRNKKSLVIDLKKTAGKQILRDLIVISDVILENFRPTTMKKLGFSWEEIQRINPKIIYASISGFGHDSLPEYADQPSYDMVAQAFSGLMSICGPEGGPPVRVGSSVGDIVAGHQCTIAILSALWHREKTGRGQKIDQSMIDGLVYVLENAIVRYTVAGEVPRPLGTVHPSITPFQSFETEDGWIVTPIGNDTLWQKFCRALDHPELARDERFGTNALRTKNRGELTPILAGIIKGRTTEAWTTIFKEHGLPYSPINTVDKVVEDPNIKYRKMIVEIDQTEAGPMRIAGSPFRLSETPGEVYSPAPLLGEHTRDVLKSTLGYPEERINELRKAGVVFTQEDIRKGRPEP